LKPGSNSCWSVTCRQQDAQSFSHASLLVPQSLPRRRSPNAAASATMMQGGFAAPRRRGRKPCAEASAMPMSAICAVHSCPAWHDNADPSGIPTCGRYALLERDNVSLLSVPADFGGAVGPVVSGTTASRAHRTVRKPPGSYGSRRSGRSRRSAADERRAAAWT
jgi:hypothetical protein